jgi:pimeloyl-ACP methyl ester carboxylesterase
VTGGRLGPDLFFKVQDFGPAGDQKMRYHERKPDGEVETNIPVVCIHGFGGNADQWRFNLPELAKQGYSAYALDLMGYGYSDKPSPKDFRVNELYNFQNWADQTCQFVDNVVKEPSVLVSNSVGGLVALQAAVERPDLIKGVILIDISLRLLHETKQSALQKPFVKLVQDFLRESPLGGIFFSQVAEFRGLLNILRQAYAGDVSDETVKLILEPGLQPGAADVFLDFISYSSGPLPEQLLPKVKSPVRILWGENDPWEPIDMGRAYADKTLYPCVDEFVPLPGAGHCPMDQTPEKVNEEILRFLKDYKF